MSNFKKLIKLFAFAIFSSIIYIYIFSSCEVGLGASVDVEKPTIKITYPPENAVIRESFILSGTCSDDRELKSVRIQIKNSKGEIVNDSLKSAVSSGDAEIYIKETKNSESEWVEFKNIITFPNDGSSKNAKWRIELNTPLSDGEYPIKDGKYTIMVHAVDTTNRESDEYLRLFQIDNTAPFFIIESPGSTEDFQTYGSFFKISGNILEDNNVSYMKMIVYDENKNAITSTSADEWIEKNIDIQGKTTVTFARYGEGYSDNLYNRYIQIYGEGTTGEVNRYVSLLLGDNAGVYRTENYEDPKGVTSDDANDEFPGNYTTSLWLNDEINGEPAGENNLIGNGAALLFGKRYDKGDLLKIYNGTYTKTDAAETDEGTEKVRAVLNKCRKDTSKNQLAVSLNKDANPTYQFSGCSFEGTETIKVCGKKDILTLEAYSGLDETFFSPKTMKVYLFGPYTDDNFKTELISSIYSDVSENYETEKAKGRAQIIFDAMENSSVKATSVSSWNNDREGVIIQLPDTIKAKKHYILVLSGNDTNGVSFVPANGFYGFTASSSSNPPNITIVSPDADSVGSSSQMLKFSGKTSALEEDDPIMGVKYSITVIDALKKEDNVLGVITGELSEKNISLDENGKKLGVFGESDVIEWNFDAAEGKWIAADGVDLDSPLPEAGNVYKYVAKITGTTEKDSNESISVQIDRKNPDAQIMSVQPQSKEDVIEGDDSGIKYPFVNGKITVTTTASDSNLDDIKLYVKDSEGNQLSEPVTLENYGQTIIDTVQFADRSLIKIELIATDKAGNTNEKAEKYVYIDQSTDYPVIKLTNADETILSKEGLTATPEDGKFGNVFEASGILNKLSGELSDDDKIAKYTIEYTTDLTSDAPEWTVLEEKTLKTLSTTSYKFDTDLKTKKLLLKESLPEGVYRIRISVEDFKEDESAPAKTETQPFFIAMDYKVPDLVISTKSGSFFTAGEKQIIKGTASDTSGISRVTRKTDDGEVNITVDANGSWSDEITVLSENTTLTYVAYDKYNRSTDKQFSYVVDNDNPVLTVTSPAETGAVYVGSAFGKSNQKFTGKANDTGDVKSGVKAVLYRIITVNSDGTKTYSAGSETVPDYANWSLAGENADDKTDSVFDWSANVELGTTSAEKIVQFVSVDNSGRYSEPATRKVIVDGVLPVIQITKIEDTVNDAARTVTAPDGVYYVQSGYKISGKITEKNLDSIKIAGKPVEFTDNNDGTYLFAYETTSVSAGLDSVLINAVDKAAQSSSESINIYVDLENPKPSLTITPLVNANGKSNNVNGNITVRGTATDNNRVYQSQIKIIDKEGGTEFDKGKVDNPANFTYEIPVSRYISLGALNDKYTYIVKVVSTDMSGRTASDEVEIYVDQSTDYPVVSLSNTDKTVSDTKGISTEKNLFNQTSSNKILGTITDDDGIRSVKVEYAPVTEGANGTGETAGSYTTLMSAGNENVSASAEESVNLGTTYSLSAVLKDSSSIALSEKKYKIRITVLDTTDDCTSHQTVEEFYIAIDNGAPDLKVSTENGYKKSSFTVEGTAKDAALKAIYRYKVVDDIKASAPDSKWIKGGSENTITYDENTKKWTDSYSEITDGGDAIYIAEDEYGQTSEAAFSWKFDAQAPTTAPDWSAENWSGIWKNVSTQQFKIPVSDAWNKDGGEEVDGVKPGAKYASSSGIAYVTATIDGSETLTMNPGLKYNTEKFENSYVWYNLDKSIEDGIHTVTINAGDNTDNVTSSPLATYTVKIDTVSPVYTAFENGGYVLASETQLTSNKVSELETKPFTLKIKVSDANTSAFGGSGNGNAAGNVSGIASFKIYDGNTDVTNDFTLPQADGDKEYTFTLKNTSASTRLTTGTHTFAVETTDAAGNSARQSVTVSVDVTAPVLSLNTVTPYVSVNGVQKLNGKVTVSGKATDETALGTTGAVSYEILKEDRTSFSPEKKGSVNLAGGLTGDWSFEIDTTSLTAETGIFYVKITVSDAVGNTAGNSASPLKLDVDQTTDKPVVKLSNANVKITSESQISSVSVTSQTASENKGNLFGMGNDSIFASASDDDGIASVVLKIDGVEIKSPSDNTKPYFDPGSDKPTSYAMEIPLKTLGITGTHTLSIEVTDVCASQALFSSKYTVNTDSVNGIYFAYDDDLPTISISKINETTYADKMWTKINSDVYISVSDSSSADNHTGLSVVNDAISVWNGTVYESLARDENESMAALWDSGASSFKHSTINGNNVYKRKYTVTDKYGRSSSREISYQVDTEEPVFDSEKISIQGTNSKNLSEVALASLGTVWFSTKSLKVTGATGALVEENPETVTVTVGTEITPVNTTNAGKNKAFGTTIQFAEGINTIKFNATDKSGQTAEEISYSVKVDTVSPVYTAFEDGGYVKASDSLVSSSDVENLETKPFTFKIKVSDENTSAIGGSGNGNAAGNVSGIASFKIYDGNTDVTNDFTLPQAGGDKEYTFTLKNTSATARLTTGTHTFAVETTDAAGNSARQSVTVSVDVTAPVCTINDITPYVSASENSVTVKKFNGVVQLSGRVTDETALGKTDAKGFVTYKVLEGTTEKASATVEFAQGLSGDWNFDIDTNAITTASGTYSVVVSAKDSAGNVWTNAENPLEIKICQQTDKPEVSLTNLQKVTAYNESDKNVNLFGLGTNMIYANITDDDGIASVTVKIDEDEIADATETFTDSRKTHSISLDVSKLNLSYGDHKLYISVTDVKNETSYAVNSDDVNGIYFAYDNEIPTIKVSSFKMPAGQGVYKSENYISGMFAPEEFDILFELNDDSTAVENLILNISNINKSDESSGADTDSLELDDFIEPEFNETEGKWISHVVNTEHAYRREYTVIDKYGRTASTLVTYTVDSTAPVFNTEHIYVSGSNTTGNAQVLHSALQNVWFNTNALKVGGFGETGKIALSESHLESIEISVSGNDTSFSAVPGNNNRFNTGIEFAEGTSSITIKASDKASNETVLPAFNVKVDTTSPVVSKAVLEGMTSSVTKSASLSLKVSGTDYIPETTESGSGISKIYVGTTSGFLVANAITTVTLDEALTTVTEKVLTVDISDSVKFKDGTYSLFVKFQDGAGNVSSDCEVSYKIDETDESEEAKTSFIVDRTAPVVTVLTPVNGTTVDNTVTISGTVLDNNLLENGSKPELWIWNETASAWVQIDTPDTAEPAGFGSGTSSAAARSGNSWTIRLDSTKIDGASGSSTDAYLSVRITDEAGNVSAVPVNSSGSQTAGDYKLIVSQDHDRPVIKMNDLTDGSSTVRKYATAISGMITDDDGISEFYICEGNEKIDESESFVWSSTEENWAKYITYFKKKSSADRKLILDWTSNASFVYTPENSSDGSHPLYFYIKDSAGNVFYTGKPSVVGGKSERPYINYRGADENIDNTNVISYKTDQTPPSIDVSQYAMGTKRRAGTVTLASYDIIPDNFYAGGSLKSVVSIHIEASDALGIKSVEGKLGTSALNFIKNEDKENCWTVEAFIGKYIDGYIETDEIWESGTYTLSVIVKDNSDLTTQITKTLHVDNTPPTVKDISPKSNVLQSGEFTVQGYTEDSGDGGRVETLKYLVMNDKLAEKSDSSIIETMNSDEIQINSGSETRFTFHFDGEYNPKFPATAKESENYSVYKRGDSDYYEIPVYFLAIDNYGNETLYKDYKVLYNPYADRPSTAILTPTEGDAVSGTIRVSGTAEDDKDGIGSVYIQLDVNNDTEFTPADMKILLDLGYKIYAVSSIVNKSDYAAYIVDDEEHSIERRLFLCDAVNTEADSSFWGIKCNSISWYININTKDELKLVEVENDNKEKTYPLGIRAASIDSKGTLGSWTEKVRFKINDDIPSFGNDTKLVKVEEVSGVQTVVEERRYTDLSSTSYVNGKWNLITTVTHTNGIKTVEYKLNDSENWIEIVKDSVNQNENVAASVTHGYQLTIPVVQGEGEGVVNLQIRAYESEGKQNTAAFTVNYDNTAPVIEGLEQNDEEWTSSSILKNSNNSLTIGSSVTDGAAGLGKVLFYFYRDHNSVKRIYDVGLDIKNSEGNYTYSYTEGEKSFAGIKVTGLSEYSALKENDADISGETYKTVAGLPLYGYKAVGAVRDDTNTITIPSNMHIRTGSLIQIGGYYHKITGKTVSEDGETMTLTFEGECAVSETEAFFPYAMSVDNLNSETVKRFSLTDQSIKNDDGDNMPESISGQQTSRQWSAQLHANWIPDGPVTFVMFAFDQADNVVSKTVSSQLQTSAPRLAKLHLGTDLNKNGSFTANEFETYNFLSVEGTYQDAIALTTAGYSEVKSDTVVESSRSAFKIKDKLAVIPEFTGGNGDIYVVFNNNDTKTTVDGEGFINVASYVSTTTAGTKGEGNEKDCYGSGTLNPVSGTVDGLKYYGFTNEAVGSVSTKEDDYKKMSFTFWDSTDGLTPGSDSQKCFVSVRDFVVWTTDNIAPNAVVDKFFWKGTGDGENSLYQGSTNNGHIELEGDLPLTTDTPAGVFNPDATSGEYDTDPKVSGKIVIRGSAYDDTFLKKLTFKMSTFNVNEGEESENEIATYTNGAWVKSTNTIGSAPYYEVLSVEDEYFNQKGHKVNWEVAVDTSAITDAAQTDVSFSVVAVDNSAKTSQARTASEENADSAKHRPSYKMDVVPYIAGVKSGLSSLKKNNSSVYDRTALGHYPVSSEETIWIYGFNLAGGMLYDKTLHDDTITAENKTKVSLGEAIEPTSTGTTKSWYTEAFKTNYPKVYELTYDTASSKTGISTFTSGEVSVIVNGIESLNNKNKNDAYGTAYDSAPSVGVTGDKDIYAKFYNRFPNGDNNNLLTDDVVLDVWEFDSRAVRPKNGVATQPVMAIDPVTGKVGFAFVNGNVYFSMPYGNNGDSTNSYEYWNGGLDFWNSIGLTYDSNGYSYGTAAGGDLNASKHGVDTFTIFTSRWGKGKISEGTNGYQQTQGRFGVEFIGEREYYIDDSGNKIGFTNFSKERIKSPSLAAVATSDTAKSYVYLAYYDSINDEIRFKWGVITNKKDTSDDVGMFGDNYSPSSRVSQGYSIKYSSLIAGHTENKLTTTATLANNANEDKNAVPVSNIVKTTDGQDVYAGEYVSIAVISGNGEDVTLSGSSTSIKDDVIVAVWWDGTNHQMLYSYNKKPKGIEKGKYLQSETGWSTPVSLFPTEVGEYCKVCVDENKGVHIAAYDSLNGDLWYAYLSSYDGTAKTGIVDSAGFVGSELNIDVALNTKKEPVPCISYYALSSSRPKVAKWVGSNLSSVSSVVGADADMYADSWEISVVPTASKAIIDHVNIGLWKELSGDNKGVVKNSVVFPESGVEKFKSDGNGHTNNSYGNVYGNGSENPILGYAIKDGSLGYIETAQMK